MCQQLKVLKKIHKEGKMNGYAIELAEATAEDYVKMNERLTSIETKVDDMDKKLAVQDGKLDLIINRLNSPVEDERLNSVKYTMIERMAKSWKVWAVLILFIICIALAGDKILQVLNWIPTK